jgi:alpha-L-rhamnosidase
MILYPHLKLFTTRDWKQQIFVPAPYVNTYFMVKSLLTLAKIAKVIGKQDDISIFEEKAEVRKRAIKAAYFNTFDNNFIMNAQGANAYAIDIGLGTERTYANLVSYYDALGHYDTGIFGTDILTRVLFRHGNADLAVKLLTSDGDQGFEHWRKSGATTLLEYWDVEKSRSHNHPMFGAVVSTFFDDLLGIRQVEGTAGYTALVIEPQATDKFGRMSGSITTARGKIAVAYRRSESSMDFEITIPENTDASLKFGGRIYELTAGKNVIRHEVR